MEHELTDEALIAQVRKIEYPHQVDVVDSVMAQVSKRPLLVPQHNHNKVWRYVIGAAACLAAVLVVNITITNSKDYDEPSIGNMLAEVYATDNYSIESMAIEEESSAIEDYLYTEENN